MRYHILDNIRGLTFISMFVFHTCWDLANMFGVNLPWFNSIIGYVWQQSILWMFILLSGFCWGLGHQQAKRGVIVFAAGALVSAVTMAVMPEDPVIFGVLTFMGTAMIVLCPFKVQLKSIPALPALVVCLVLFAITRDIPFGYLGFESWHIVALPGDPYANLTTAFFGFQPASFISSDYVPFIPWIFLYLTGFLAFRAWPRKTVSDAYDYAISRDNGNNTAPIDEDEGRASASSSIANPASNSIEEAAANTREALTLPQQHPWPLVGFIGKHSLEFYMLHQVAIYAALSFIFETML